MDTPNTNETPKEEARKAYSHPTGLGKEWDLPSLIGLVGLALAVGGVWFWLQTEEPGQGLLFFRVLDPGVAVGGGLGLLVGAVIVAELRRLRALLRMLVDEVVAARDDEG